MTHGDPGGGWFPSLHLPLDPSKTEWSLQKQKWNLHYKYQVSR